VREFKLTPAWAIDWRVKELLRMQNALTAETERRQRAAGNATLGEIDWSVKELLRFVNAESAG
jgi:hypothetical protein